MSDGGARSQESPSGTMCCFNSPPEIPNYFSGISTGISRCSSTSTNPISVNPSSGTVGSEIKLKVMKGALPRHPRLRAAAFSPSNSLITVPASCSLINPPMGKRIFAITSPLRSALHFLNHLNTLCHIQLIDTYYHDIMVIVGHGVGHSPLPEAKAPYKSHSHTASFSVALYNGQL